MRGVASLAPTRRRRWPDVGGAIGVRRGPFAARDHTPPLTLRAPGAERIARGRTRGRAEEGLPSCRRPRRSATPLGMGTVAPDASSVRLLGEIARGDRD